MSKRSGFTLVELLTVIAIISILAGMIYPVLTTAKEKGRITACLNNIKQLGFAVVLYADDNNGRFPNPSIANHQPDWSGSLGTSNWVYPERGSLYRYVKTVRVYRCPTDSYTPATAITGVPAGLTNKDYPLSYSMNTEFWNGGTIMTSSVMRNREVIMLIHESRASINDGDFNWHASPPDQPSNIHNGGSTVIYTDTHASWEPYGQLMTAYAQGVWSTSWSRTPPATTSWNR